jgi:hypothetical protein
LEEWSNVNERGKAELSEHSLYKFRLADMNAASVGGEPCGKSESGKDYAGDCFRVVIRALNDSNKIQREITNRNQWGVNKPDIRDEVNSVFFFFASEDLANRAAKAFIHAIELSGGKKEVF